VTAQEQLDTRTIDLANRALARIETHERVCEERWEASRRAQEEIKEALKHGFDETHRRIDEVHGRVNGLSDLRLRGAAAVIGVLLVAFGWVFMVHFGGK
jgi:phage shock protein A